MCILRCGRNQISSRSHIPAFAGWEEQSRKPNGILWALQYIKGRKTLGRMAAFMSWYRMERGWKDSEFFQKEPYSERDAWEWMIEEAAFKEKTVSVLGRPVRLKRGEFCHSVRFMASKFQWSIGRVQRFLKRAQKWNMLIMSTDTGQILISISNYSKYQDGKQSSDTSTNTPIDTPSGTQADTNNKNGKEGKKVKNKKPAARPENVSREIWDDFTSQRKTIFTETALKGIEREVAKAGITLEEGLRKAIERGWQSFEAHWVKDKGKPNERNSKYTADDALADVLGQIRADSTHNPPVFCDTEHVRQITGAAKNPDAGNDRGFTALPIVSNQQSVSGVAEKER